MSEPNASTLKATLSEVLANLAFMFADDEAPDMPEPGPWLETSIGYEGPQCGTLRFACSRTFAVELAANLLGTEVDDEASAKAADAAKEFVNVICGQLITRVFGSGDVYNLTIPETVEREQPFADALPAIESSLSVDGHSLRLRHEPATAGARA